MATTTVDARFFITNGSLSGDTITTTGSQIVVRVDTGENGVEFNYDNPVISIQQPIIDTPAKGGSDAPRTRMKNLLRLKRTITVNGYLAEESGSTSLSKRNDLDTLMNYGAVLTVVWGAGSNQQTYTGNIIKLNIKESVGQVIGGSGTSVSASHDFGRNVLLTVLVGENI